MRVILICVLTLGLGGCVEATVGEMFAGPQELARYDDDYCRSIGLPFGSPEYAQCRMFRTHERNRQDEADAARGAAMIGLGR